MQADEQAGHGRQLRDSDTQLVPFEHKATTQAETPYIREFHARNLISSLATDSHPTSMAMLGGRPVTRIPEQLRLHPALDAVGWDNPISELNDAVHLKSQAMPVPVLITSSGTILVGLGQWRLAALEGSRELHCIEYPLSEEESLRFILAYHRPRRGWNAFVRIRLALTLERHFQQKALANMRAGGKLKGSANLPEAQHIDVRQEIAKFAGVGDRNVSNVKKILQTAHQSLISALLDGSLSINRGLRFCELPKAQQLEEFIQDSEYRAIKKVIRQSLGGLRKNTLPNAFSALEALQRMEAVQPGSVMMRTARIPRTVVLVGQDLLASPQAQGKLKLR